MQIRMATTNDLPALLPLMRGYYSDDGLQFDAAASAATMTRLLEEPQWGRVFLIEVGDTTIGYVALCMGFSLELGGNDAFVDEVFVAPQHRGRGYGRQALKFAIAEAETLGVRALHLEVDTQNSSAQALYQSMGFQARSRYSTMTRKLASASPAHA
jgi:GNAT superfamily N-acetyltransferase